MAKLFAITHPRRMLDSFKSTVLFDRILLLAYLNDAMNGIVRAVKGK